MEKTLQQQKKGKNCTLKIKGYTYRIIVHSSGVIKRASQVIVSGTGRKLSYPEKQLAQSDNGNGYKSIMVNAGGSYKRFYIHRLVAEAFIPNPKKLPEVNHIDGDRANNDVSNLEWVTRKENLRKAIENNSKSGISYKHYRRVIVRYFCFAEEIKDIAKDYNVSASMISSILNGKNHLRYYKTFMGDKRVCKHLKESFEQKTVKSRGMKNNIIFGK